MSRVRRFRPSGAMVVAVVALITAMGGSAVAASLITSKQIKNGTIQVRDISKKARKALKGNRGARGPVGVAGAAGQAGAKGDKGDKGDQGEAGPLLATLPAGKTLTGTFGAAGQEGAGDVGGFIQTPVTFTFPLAQSVAIELLPPGTSSSTCPGSAAEPTAPPGRLCMYEGARTNVTINGVCGYVASTCAMTEPGTATAAAIDNRHGFTFEASGAGPGVYYVNGSWAVTAPTG